MQQLVTDIRSAMAQRVQSATARDLLSMASRLVDDEQSRIVAPPTGPRILRPDFEIIDSDVALDRSTGLYWLRDYAPGGRRDWDASKAAVELLTVNGWTWRMPEIWERLSIVDYTRSSPALNTDVFRAEKDVWEWTATNYAPFEGYAWIVAFVHGYAYGNLHGNHFCVRAVCAGQ